MCACVCIRARVNGGPIRELTTGDGNGSAVYVCFHSFSFWVRFFMIMGLIGRSALT